jgi:hypothetical protein
MGNSSFSWGRLGEPPKEAARSEKEETPRGKPDCDTPSNEQLITFLD